MSYCCEDVGEPTSFTLWDGFVLVWLDRVSFFVSQVLKRVVPVAVDRAIREIIQPVVERSVTIACITSKELVQKDFAMEADENKMRKVIDT